MLLLDAYAVAAVARVLRRTDCLAWSLCSCASLRLPAPPGHRRRALLGAPFAAATVQPPPQGARARLSFGQ